MDTPHLICVTYYLLWFVMLPTTLFETEMTTLSQDYRLSLYQSSFIPSVINLWNSLYNDTRNTRTSDSFKINLKSKVVLAKIPAHFLVGDRRHNILYARWRRSCSSLKSDLFRSNIITDSRCVCGFTREDASHFPLNCRLYIEQRTVLFHFLHHHDFQRDIRTLLFGDSKKTKPKIYSYRKQYRHSLRTVGDSLKEHNSPLHFTYLLSFNFAIP